MNVFFVSAFVFVDFCNFQVVTQWKNGANLVFLTRRNMSLSCETPGTAFPSEKFTKVHRDPCPCPPPIPCVTTAAPGGFLEVR